MLGKWLGERQEWAPLLLRVTLGVIFFAHGCPEVVGWYGGSGWSGTIQFFTPDSSYSRSARGIGLSHRVPG
jgi:putative oxidoreductase